jgi:hypothetical protein
LSWLGEASAESLNEDWPPFPDEMDNIQKIVGNAEENKNLAPSESESKMISVNPFEMLPAVPREM